jgi:nucleoside phosphorylase
VSDTPLFLAPLRLEAIAAGRARPRPEIRRIGMGPVAATTAMAKLSRELSSPRPLVLFGFAGALQTGIRPGEIFVARSITGLDSDEEFPLPEAAGLAEFLSGAGVDVQLGTLVSSPRILHGAVEREKAAAGGAVICDMEALWMAPLARRHPFVVVRAVVDTVEQDVISLSTPANAARGFSSLVRLARALVHWAPTTVVHYPLVEAGES